MEEMAEAPTFIRSQTREIVYTLNGRDWSPWLLGELLKAMEMDAVPQEAELQIDFKNKQIKAVWVNE